MTISKEIVGFQIKDLLPKLQRPTSVHTAADAHRYGVEIELEYVGYGGIRVEDFANIDSPWIAEQDGSLRGANSEFVLKVPLSERMCLYAVDWLQHYLRETGRRINEKSTRTSTHVHINFSDRNTYDLAKFYLCYLMCEPTMLSIAGPNREGNNFCLPTYLSDQGYNIFRRMCTRKPSTRIHENSVFALCRVDRYAALNFRPLSKFGSVEIRFGRGMSSTDDKFVQEWITLIDRLFQFSQAHTMEECYSATPSEIIGVDDGRYHKLNKIYVDALFHTNPNGWVDFANCVIDEPKKATIFLGESPMRRY